MGIKVGVALGSGAARGWAHIGVLRALQEMGVKPDILCGTSIGAAVGAAHLTDQLDALQDWAQRMGWLGMLGIIDLTFRRGGLVAVEKAIDPFLNERTDVRIEDLPIPFAAAATDLSTGREVWLRDGPLLPAVLASAAMPGLFPAVPRDGQWLVDGALVNPVPVSLCRALGADVVIAVNLNSERTWLGRRPEGKASPASSVAEALPPAITQLTDQVAGWLGRKPNQRTRFLAEQLDQSHGPTPNALEVMAGSIDIMQDRITRSRLAGEPPDALIAPRLGHIGILDFDRAAEAVELGRAATLLLRPHIEQALAGA
ncbi:patatin-like phospholipase family protein [Azospirillum griseum]|uniref:Patatin n=1 Tax=Azospirillum griseum TaxID=2496639 RepID=A0A431VNM9_9PROT|nr:patatin-like phospholipase family protein [Azospirillum griseum]RTR24273.1 patatin [Azospirillum griseum]